MRDKIAETLAADGLRRASQDEAGWYMRVEDVDGEIVRVWVTEAPRCVWCAATAREGSRYCSDRCIAADYARGDA